jgi:hypothetical protein
LPHDTFLTGRESRSDRTADTSRCDRAEWAFDLQNRFTATSREEVCDIETELRGNHYLFAMREECFTYELFVGERAAAFSASLLCETFERCYLRVLRNSN